jgi:predicted secreted protein
MWIKEDTTMVDKRYIVVALASFCVAFALFSILWTQSNAIFYSSQADINGDDTAPSTEPIMLYDSGWINISDKAGQIISIVHNLNSTDILVDITGKRTEDGGIHQRNLGGTEFKVEIGKTYGCWNNEFAYSVVQARDGGYLLAGTTNSLGESGVDVWLVKIDADGNALWNKTFGGDYSDIARHVIQTNDGGYALIGYTSSFGAGECDAWLVRMDSNGNMQWNKTFGGIADDFGWFVAQTSDGGYVLAGYTWSFGAGMDDFWLIKTDANGNAQWNKTYGGTGEEAAYSLALTSDGGYALTGFTSSSGAGGLDFWLVKVDANGTTEWNQTYGGIGDDYSYGVIQTNDGGYATAGQTNSFGAGAFDAWLVKIDSNGNMQWNKTYGGLYDDCSSCVVQTSDGGFALEGETYTRGIGYDSYFGHNSWLVKTSVDGDTQWNRTYEGSNGDSEVYSVIRTNDGGYALVGHTSFSDAYSADFWLIKTDESGIAQWMREWLEYGLAWIDSTPNSITLLRGTNDASWNFVRVRISKLK